MSRRPLRRAAAGVLLLLALAACGETSCPLVGCSNELLVSTEGLDAAALEVCPASGCPTDASADDALELLGEPAVVVAGRWTVTTTGRPDVVALRALDAQGRPLADVVVEPRWTRTGGSRACGGPHRASVTVPGS